MQIGSNLTQWSVHVCTWTWYKHSNQWRDILIPHWYIHMYIDCILIDWLIDWLIDVFACQHAHTAFSFVDKSLILHCTLYMKYHLTNNQLIDIIMLILFAILKEVKRISILFAHSYTYWLIDWQIDCCLIVEIDDCV